MGNYNIKLKSATLYAQPIESSSSIAHFKWLEYLNIFFNFNKLESDNLIPPVRMGNKQLYSTSLDLYRYSKFGLGFDINFVKLQGYYYSISFDFIGGIYHTPIDSVFTGGGDTLSVKDGLNSFYTGSKLNIHLQANEYVDFNVGYYFTIPQLFSDNKLKEIYKPITDPNFSEHTRVTYFNPKFWIHNIYAEFSIYPDPEDKSSFLFLKSGLVFNNSDNYVNLMLGYSLPFSNLISIGQSIKSR